MSRPLISLIVLTVIGSCVDPFEPELEESQELVVISGLISDSPGRHTIEVSLSTPYSDPAFRPLEQCVVSVINQEGEMVHYLEEGAGIYAADIPGSFLDVGDVASVLVVTDRGEYRSDFDTILPCPGIDSLYWELGGVETAVPGEVIPGIQFYLDMSGTRLDSRNIMWQLEESWEYKASLIGNLIWRSPGSGTEEFKSNVIFRCWKEYFLDQFFIATTKNLTSNELKSYKLNFVSNETDRLSLTYSLLVKQQSLTLSSYEYWTRMHEQALESGGLYEKQPAAVQGNLYNTEDPGELVLGNFFATQVRRRRIFVHNNNFFEFQVPHISCEYEPMSWLWEQEYIEYPVYIYSPGTFQPPLTGPSYCFDCLLQGGDTIRPPYWESWH